ncbi:MAG: zf-HC2 domain-containing protein [Actinomycetota bacterium]
MTGPACRDVRQSLGVYVVGAIDPAERMLVDLHLASCAECKAELAGLAPLPELLARVPAHDAERVIMESADLRDFDEPPAALLAALLREVSARRAAGRWRGIVAVAAAVVFAIAIGVAGAHILVPGTQAHPPSAIAAPEVVRGYDAQTHVSAIVSYTATSWGTTMDVSVQGIPAGTTCQLWVVNQDGTRSPAGSWKVAYGHTHEVYPAEVSLAASDVREFQVISGNHVIVSVPADRN